MQWCHLLWCEFDGFGALLKITAVHIKSRGAWIQYNMYGTEQHFQPWLLCSNHDLWTSFKHAGIYLIKCKQFSFQFREEDILKNIDEKKLKDNSGFKNDTFMLSKQKATETIASSLETRTDFNGYGILWSSLPATLGVHYRILILICTLSI